MDMAIEAGDLGEYFNLCQKKCADSEYSQRRGKNSSGGQGVGLGPLLAAEPPYQGEWNGAGKTLRALAGAFHSLSKPGGPPVFGTQHSLDSTTGFRTYLAGLPDERVHKGLACVGSDARCGIRLLCSIQTTAVITATRSSPCWKNRAQVSLTACAGSRGDVETYTGP